MSGDPAAVELSYIAYTLFYTGIRVEELVKLDLADVQITAAKEVSSFAKAKATATAKSPCTPMPADP